MRSAVMLIIGQTKNKRLHLSNNYLKFKISKLDFSIEENSLQIVRSAETMQLNWNHKISLV